MNTHYPVALRSQNFTSAMTAPEVEIQFKNAICAAGLLPPDTLKADGTFHRFSTNGKRSDDSGWYILHPEDGVGFFGCFRSSINRPWHAGFAKPVTNAERMAFRSKLAAARRQRQEATAQQQEYAAVKATRMWNTLSPASLDHPYLKRKQILPHGVRQYGQALVVPMSINGKLRSLQFIDPAGNKRYLRAGEKKAAYFLIGDPAQAQAIALVEGFATGASVHEATSLAVAVAFDADNLLPAARSLRKAYPDTPIVVCADDDIATAGNPGKTKGQRAADAVNGVVVIPEFGDNRPADMTDFNDLACLLGAQAVQDCIVSVVAPDTPGANDSPVDCTSSMGVDDANSGITDLTSVTTNDGGPAAVMSSAGAGVTAVTPAALASLSVSDKERPCFRVVDVDTHLQENNLILHPGVWYFDSRFGRQDDSPPQLTQQWVCSPLHIEAITHDQNDNNFGRKLRFVNSLGQYRTWAMPMELLKGQGDEMRGELLSMGVHIDPGSHKLLGKYLQMVTPQASLKCALQVGWCGDAFVLPNQVIGPGAEKVIFQTGERYLDEYAQAGTFEGWQAGIAAPAPGNVLLLLSIAASFAGALLAKCHADNFGIHLVGDSSTGKTTLATVASATWGGPSNRRSWRATANGMEGVAALFCDGMLVLDEISECSPREVGAIVYMLANGHGKQRASRTGSARAIQRWRCVVFSTGERTISTSMAEGGEQAKAGQAVRLLDIPVERLHGAWDDLHGAETGAAFSDALRHAAATHHGHAGPLFLRKLAEERRDLRALLEKIKALPQFQVTGAEGQEKRAAHHLALVALAGELATEYGITGWQEGAALAAAAEALALWQDMRGNGNAERRDILARLQEFIDRHGDSRFSSMEPDQDDAIRHNRAGWWRDDCNGRQYLFTAAGMREALKGFDFKRALKVLTAAGVLPPTKNSGEHAERMRLHGALKFLYVVHPGRLGN